MVSLDDSQKKFIQAPEGNIRLLAPAGCGKTLCLLYRCKFLAETSPTRQRFLIVTFTRAARDELKSRINEDSEFASIRDRDQTVIATLNSWGLRRLRSVKHSVKTVKSNAYKSTMDNLLQSVWINRDHERIEHAIKKHYQAPKELMKMIDAFMSLGFDHRRQTSFSDFSRQWERLIGHGLGWWLEEQVGQLIQFEILEEVSGTDPVEMQREVFFAWYGFWCKAVQMLSDSATVTFEGQKYFAWQVERKNIEDGSFLSGAASYDHVFVDEFQDINPLDLALVRTIVERNRATLTITGDDDQAIYEWRGATPEYIVYPEEHFDAPFATITLGRNYRSPSNIVEMSQRLIANNRRRVPKQIAAHGTKKAEIEIKRVRNLSESLEFVHDLVDSSLAQGKSRSQIALVGRLKSQIIPYQILFASADIPFCAAEDLLIHLSDTYKNLQSLLDIKAGAYGRQSTRRVVEDILLLCGFVKRYKLSRKDEGSLSKFLQKSRPNSFLSGIDALAEYRGELKRVKNEDGRINIEMADAIRTLIDSERVSHALHALSDNFAGLRKDFFKAEDDIFFKDPPFLQLAEYAMRYDSDFDSFIYDISEARATLYKAPYDDDIDDLSKTPVHLMTAQRAKGKEFEKVVLLDVHDGVWPHKNAEGHKQQEAERRVFYVGFTRARKQISMLVNTSAPVSPYIDELGL
ncbi:MAG: ATP-dependent helicase [Anaerolineaceae bacterium]|nr:ATP-dependent helicase [Anaerolineaceae bacterium]